MIDLEKYISGTNNDKKKIDKTTGDFVSEWFSSLFRTRYLVFLFISLLGGSYVFNFYGLKIAVTEYLPALIPVFVGLGFLAFPIIVIACIIFLVRTLGLILNFFNTDVAAESFEVSAIDIQIKRKDGKIDTYLFEKIRTMQIIYNTRALMVSAPKFTSYMMPLEPKDIETRLLATNFFHKQVTFLESREGYIRWVYYTNLALEKENEMFITSNKNLPKQLFNNTE